MYHPTHFENLKVAFENRIYDLDNIDEKITIVNRSNRTDFAVLSRELSIQFTLVDQPDVTAEVLLAASLEDLAGEILETYDATYGCTLFLRFYKHVHDAREQCVKIEEALYAVWENDIELKQTLSFTYGEDAPGYLNQIEVKFKVKISEENMREIPPFLEHVLKTLEVLNDV
ncbi:group-specific protein [Bacillus freudenreichii]|nr:group-specific protein [Bacillus freudenreichii]